MIDDSFSPYIGEPLLHYMDNRTSAPYAFLETSDDVIERTTYNAPLNATTTFRALTFRVERSEWSNNNQNINLFYSFYQNYMSDVFNKQRRITSIKAWLPLNILLNYNLGDRFKINQNLYRINSITTNLQSGESDIELLNEV